MTTVRDLPLRHIRPGPNDRTVFAPAAIEELAGSIRADGLAQPVTVRPLVRCRADSCATRLHPTRHSPPPACPHCGAPDPYLYEIVAGERRYRAFLYLDRKAIPAIIRSLTDEQAASIMLAENVHRVDLNPMDEAQAYHSRQVRFGWTTAQVARRARVSVRRVEDRLSLLQLVPEAGKLIRDGHLSVGFGEAMSPLDVNRQRIALRYLVTEKRPAISEFRAIVGRLLLEQTQESLFNFDDFILSVRDDRASDLASARASVWPVDETLPPPATRHPDGKPMNVALTFETYLHALLTSTDPRHVAAAPTIGRLYSALIAANILEPPRTSPLRPPVFRP